MDVEELYDEFGNYIGPERSDSDSDSLELPERQTNGSKTNLAANSVQNGEGGGMRGGIIIDAANAHEHDGEKEPLESNAIVLAEDKLYYPSAEEVFGPETEVLVEEEDTQPITEPIIAPVYKSSSGLHEVAASIPPARFSRAYLTRAVLPISALIRNVALVGHLHHGKTSFADMLFEVSHEMPWNSLDDRDLPVRYMDMRRDEQALHVSLKTTAATLLLQNHMEKSFGVTVLDTPGHVNFLDECVAAMSLVDGVVVLVDVAEGVMMGTEVLLQKAARMRMDIVLVISKLDRLCLELRIPPADAYHKIRHIIESVNDIIMPLGGKRISPSRGNVAFASSSEGVCFTLKQIARTYIESCGQSRGFPLTDAQLAKRLWGNHYYDKETRKFSSVGSGSRTFVDFVLSPFYKLHTAVVSEDVEDLTEFLKNHSLLGKPANASQFLNGSIDRKALDQDLKALLKEVLSNSYGMGSISGFVDMLSDHIGCPTDRSAAKVEVMRQTSNVFDTESNSTEDKWMQSLVSCDPAEEAPMTAYVGKLVPDEEGSHFDCLARIFCGRICIGETVRVLGDGYDRRTNSEDQATAVVGGLYIPCARFNIEVNEAVAGQIVLVRGVDQTVLKSATIVSAHNVLNEGAIPFRPLTDFIPNAVTKVAVEPIRPSELPKMVASLQNCVKSFPGLITKVEESGEHTVTGSGELYMDCVLRDLREAYGKIEIKVSDPLVPFAETVSETSALQCSVISPNRKNKIVMIAEPLEEDILQVLEDGTLEKNNNSPDTLRKAGWDALAAKSLWAFGPDSFRGPNAFLNDVLIQETRRGVDRVRDSILNGFLWVMREGPLANEPVRGVKLRLLDADLHHDAIERRPGQIITMSLRAINSSILTATPRLLEPIFKTEIISAPEALPAAYMLIGRRRGVVLNESEVAGTPLMRLDVHMPVLDSYGFEPDLRSLTHGGAFCTQMYSHWALVPGDPLDRTVELRPLEPAGRRELARECMVKTRRRKGLGDEVSITTYLNDPLLHELAKDNDELRQLLLRLQ